MSKQHKAGSHAVKTSEYFHNIQTPWKFVY